MERQVGRKTKILSRLLKRAYSHKRLDFYIKVTFDGGIICEKCDQSTSHLLTDQARSS